LFSVLVHFRRRRVGELTINKHGWSAGFTFSVSAGSAFPRQLARRSRNPRLHILRGRIDVAAEVELQILLLPSVLVELTVLSPAMVENCRSTESQPKTHRLRAAAGSWR